MKELLMVVPPQQVAHIQVATVSTSPGQASSQHYPTSNPTKVNSVQSTLEFVEMQARYDNIDDAHPKTFEWILEPPQDEQPLWDSFLDWLKNEEPVY
ncbi:uncharacterized protein A1O9_06528 [Exophiala aquamarina CBS 119918]|uniref:Uncharacterized protein n=1 Tax=Exophiala aquamarina CBS 119918 TaxID=1182545 RepID=A0A072PFR2_9EURO|nr:uncharacterized protein A1O9_06528 [Exophiala aquamarina CBS 119918]KEF58602.1 hypothetical protein A1O9_06528 [Exophiala aquamarina CBS 119918]